MASYLWTPADVLSASIRRIGTLSSLSFADVALLYDNSKEKIAVPISFKPNTHPFLKETVVTNWSKEEWEQYQNDIETYCKSDPEVHVVDKKWAIPI